MPDLIRSLTAHLREFVGNRRRVPRRTARCSARLPFSVSLLDTKRSAGDGASSVPSVGGRTHDLSETGLTLIVPTVRLGDRYLTDAESNLQIALELPAGPVRMLARSVRFKQFAEGDAEAGFLISVYITGMSDGERARYVEYLRTLVQMERRVRQQRRDRNGTASLMVKSAGEARALDGMTPAQVNKRFEDFEKSLRRKRRRL